MTEFASKVASNENLQNTLNTFIYMCDKRNFNFNWRNYKSWLL